MIRHGGHTRLGFLAGALALTLTLGSAAVFAAIKTNTFSSGDVDKPVPGLGTAKSKIRVDKGGKVKDVNVSVRVAGADNEDNFMFLILPDGDEIELTSGNGGFSSGYGSGPGECSDTMVKFDDEAATPIEGHPGPFASGGSFQPEVELSRANKIPVMGKWKLEVGDTDDSDGGSTIHCWKLKIKRKTG